MVSMIAEPLTPAAAKMAPIALADLEIDRLIVRVETSCAAGEPLHPDDVRILIEALKWLMHVTERLEANDLTIAKLKKLLGIISASERAKDLPLPTRHGGDATAAPSDGGAAPAPARGRGHGRPNKDSFPGASVQHHSHPHLGKGSSCPDCRRGKLYKFEPAQFVRVTGHAPLSATVHVQERWRCNLCHQTFKAPLPQAVTQDGAGGRRFGFSATATVALLRYGAGMPHYRQHSLQKLLGVPVSTSTLWDLSEGLANAAAPVYGLLKKQAASAWLYYSDDTSNRILSQGPVKRKKRGSKKDIERTGVNTSSLVACLEDGPMIILYKTGINHAGEALDEILKDRPPDLPPYLHMSDGLSSNVPTVAKGIELDCNVHARRQYVDLADKFPAEVDFIVETYRQIYQNERQAAGMTAEERLAHHKKESLPLMEAMMAWGQRAFKEHLVEPNSTLGGAISYMLKRAASLKGFCHYIGAPIDNNLLERKLKMVVLHRKNSLFFKEPLGAKVGDILMSLIATAAQARVNVFDYLVALQRQADDVKKRPEEYMPWKFARLSTVESLQ